MRKAVAQYYRLVATGENYSTAVNGGSSVCDTDGTCNETNTTYNFTIDGREVSNPLQDALDTGVCVISGYPS